MKCVLKKNFKILLVFSLVLFFLVGCGAKKTETLVIGNGEMNGVFNPFFVETNADQNVVKLTAVTLNRFTSEGLLEGYAADYMEPKEILGEDGAVEFTKYTYRLNKSMTFSDGTPVTARDVIFSIKVLCDPTYNGLSTINTLPIVGLQEYRYDTADYEKLVSGFEKEANNISKAFVENYIKSMAADAVNTYSEEELTSYMGIELDSRLKGQKRMDALEKAYLEFELANSFEFYIEGAQAEKVKQLQEAYLSSKAGDFKIKDIEGVKAIDNNTVEITLVGVNPSAIWDFGEIVVASEKYYGDGFIKGDLSSVRAKDGIPFGAGPYLFESYKNNVVTLVSNEKYFLGKPHIPKIKLAYTTKANTIEGIALGEMDIADVEATQDEIGKINENKLHYVATDFQGYGYIGINSNRIPDINVRKGLLSLVHKETAVNTYFGGLATVIERPISISSWAYPKNAKAIYTYDKAKALAYFTMAGYVQEKKNGAMTLTKNGQQLSLVAGVGGEGTMDHPAALIFTQMKLDIEEMGGKLEINDCDLNVLTEGLYQGSFDLWAASWDASIDPSDMNGIYMTGAEGNFYGIKSYSLDRTLVEASATTNMEVRKSLYGKAMDIIMEEAVEMPVYQRKHLYVFNPKIVDISSLPDGMTEYRGYLDDIEKLKLI